MLTNAETPRLRAGTRRRIPLPVIGGMIFGGLLVFIGFQLEPKWVFYICAGIIALAALPMVTMMIRGLDRFFMWAFLISQQLQLSFNFVSADQAMPGGVQGLNVTLQFLLGAVYFFAWQTRETKDPNDERGIRPAFLHACILFLLVCSLSFLNTTTKSYTMYGLFYHFGLVITALAACHICSSRVGVAALWKSLWITTMAQGAILLVQRVANVSFSLTGEVIDSKWGDRFGGTMGIAPVSSATLLMGLVLFCELRLLRGNKSSMYTWGPAFGLGFLCLLLSLTRSAWIGCGIGSVYLVWWVFRRGGLSSQRGMALAAAAFVGLVIAQGPVRDRLDANHSYAAEERWRLNYINLEMVKAHPMIGIGLNTVFDSRKKYLPSFFGDDEWIYIAHNQYLLIAAEAGLLGLAAFLRVLWVAIASAAVAARSPDPLVGETGAVLFAYLLAFCWGMFLDFYGGMQVYVILWFFWGCAVGVRVLAYREASKTTATPALENGGAN